MVERKDKTKKTGGPKLNDALAAQLLEHLRAGHYKNTASRLCGIHPTTLSDWLAREDEPYASFRIQVLAAEAEAERVQLARIFESPEPADAKWFLGRKFPDRWAETKRVDVSGRFDMGIKLNADLLSTPEARAAVLTLTDALFADGNAEPDSAGENSE